MQNRDLSPNCLWYQHSCFDFTALCLSDSLFTTRRLTRVPAKTAALIFVSTDVTAYRASVANTLSVYLVTRSLTAGSFRVRSTNFLLNLRDPPPISMKFGSLADNT